MNYTQEEDVFYLCDMFHKDRKDVLEAYRLCNNNREETLEYLLNKPLLEDYKSVAKTQVSNQSTNINTADFSYLGHRNSCSTSVSKLDDYGAYQQLLDEYVDVVPAAELKRIWHNLRKELKQECTIEQRLELAKDYALSFLDVGSDEIKTSARSDSLSSCATYANTLVRAAPTVIKTEDSSATISTKHVTPTEDEYTQYLSLFDGLLPYEVIYDLWNSAVEDSGSDTSAGSYEYAICYALTKLEQGGSYLGEEWVQDNVTPFIQNSTSVDSSDGSSQANNGDSSEESTAEVFISFVEQYFLGTGVGRIAIERALKQLNFDIDSTINWFSDQIGSEDNLHSVTSTSMSVIPVVDSVAPPISPAKSCGFVTVKSKKKCKKQAQQMRYKQAVTQNTNDIQQLKSWNGSSVETENRPAVTIIGPIYAKDQPIKSSLETQRPIDARKYEWTNHFLVTFKNHNPDAVVVVRDGKLQYAGTKKGLSEQGGSLSSSPNKHATFKLATEVIDLHLLSVAYAIQIVDSATNYYYTNMRDKQIGKSGYAAIKCKRMMIKFVVGKGLHSTNGKAKLGPSVVKYAYRNNIDHVMKEGEVWFILKV